MRKLTCLKIAFIVLSLPVIVIVGILVLIELMPQWFSAPVVMPQHTAEVLWANPLPTPNVINSVPTSFEKDQRLCVRINTYNLWEMSEQDIYETVQKTTGVTIDSRPIPQMKLLAGEFSTLVVRGFYADGRPKYIHGGEISVCFEPPPLSPGLHVATIRFESNTGTPHSHEWAFNVP